MERTNERVIHIKRFCALLFALLMGVSLLAGCADEEDTPSLPYSAQIEKSGQVQFVVPGVSSGDTWTVLVYLCGTDLETNFGCASDNVKEMMTAAQSNKVNVVIQTGGTQKWKIEDMDPSKLERWKVSDGQIKLVDSQPLANMGAADTLGAFLKWGVTTYPADKYACVLWDHGGGSITGIVADELYDDDGLNLKELATGVSIAGTPFELIGFDACLMSTMETAAALTPYARYMVASQELVPGSGWDYVAWLSYLAQNPSATGLEVGKVICDSFYEKCKMESDGSLATLAVTDLAKIPALVAAFDTMSAEMKGFTAIPEKMQPLTQALVRAENYGGNNDNEGYTNMVDLGDMTLCTKGVLSKTGETLLDALFAAVPYRVAGNGRQKSNGLSVYVPLIVEHEEMDAYAQLAAVSGEYLRFLEGVYGWKVPTGVVINHLVVPQADTTGGVTPSAREPVQVDDLTIAQAMNAEDLEIEFQTKLTEGGNVQLIIDKGAEMISNVAYSLFYLDEETSEYYFMGSDFDVNMNETGTIYWDNFKNLWLTINGHFCSMVALDWNENYILYTVPVRVNGKETNLRMLYHYDTAAYEIIGVWAGIDSATGMSNRDVKKLQDGDKVELLFNSHNMDTEVEDTLVSGEFVVKGTPVVEETVLFDGVFYYQYEITDILGNVYKSDLAMITSENGEIILGRTD